MNKTLFTLFIAALAITANAQSDSGLIAHWDMNGEVNDVTGNGHNGTASNLTSDTGYYGQPNTAYYFNGVNSIITAPYMPDLNISKYSICAVIKVEGFYSGLCQGNFIFDRGTELQPGSYVLSFCDNPFDSSCNIVDSSEDFLQATLGSCTPVYNHDWTAGPTILKNLWYKMVITFDGTQWQLFLNDTLRTTIVTGPGSIGTSTENISMGMSIFGDASLYPNNFKGLMDDIRLYNRVLTDSEAVHYFDTCGTITKQPVSFATAAGGNATYTVNSSIIGADYQWQQDAGLGYVSLSNSGPYSGVTTPTLTVAGITTSMDNYHYRCLISNTWGCSDTSVSALLSTTLGINNTLLNNNVLLYPNPVKNDMTVIVPYNNSNGELQLINDIGQILYQKTISNKTTYVDISTLPVGIYMARIAIDGQVAYRKVIRN